MFEQASLMAPAEFQHILRILNTNVDGRQRTMYALTAIPGVGRRLSNLICKKADVNPYKRAGEMSNAEIERLVGILSNPLQFKIPQWFLNRQRDVVTGKFSHLVSNQLHTKLREDLERLKKMHCHRGLRHFWGIKVRGQHTKTTGRGGHTVGFDHKK